MESGLAVTVLEVDLELRPGEEILVDPGLAVPEHTEHQSVVSLSCWFFMPLGNWDPFPGWKPTLMTT